MSNDRLDSQPRPVLVKAVPVFLAIGVVLLVAFHCFMLATKPIFDWDAAETLRGYSLDDASKFRGNMVHPILGVLGGRATKAIFGHHMPLGWACLIGLCECFALAAIYWGGKLVDASLSGRLFGMIVYLANPAILNLAGRDEDNFTFHGLYILAALAFLRFANGPKSRKNLGFVILLNTLCALTHLQALMILTSSEALYLFLRAGGNVIAGRGTGGTRRLVFGGAIDAILVCVLPWLALAIYLFAVKLPPADYYRQFPGLYTQTNLGGYITSFLASAHDYLFSGQLIGIDYKSPSLRCTNLGVIASGACLSAFLLAYLAVHAKRELFLACLGLTAFVFVFGYEPLSPERWDTLVMALAILLALRASKGMLAIDFIFAAVLLAHLPFSIGQNAGLIKTKNARQAALASEMNRHSTLYVTDRDAASAEVRSLVFELPVSIGVARINSAMPPGEYCFYLSKAALGGLDPRINAIRRSDASGLTIVAAQ